MFVIKRGMIKNTEVKKSRKNFFHTPLCLTIYIIKGGRKETVYFDKITSRISKLCYGLNMEFIDPVKISQKVL